MNCNQEKNPTSLRITVVSKLALVLIAGAAVFFAGLSQSRADDAAVARVGETDIGAGELRGILGGLDSSDRAALARDPALLNRTVRALLVQRLVLEEALAKQWDRDPAVLARLERSRQTTLVETYLDAVATPPAGYPSETELKGAYEANRAAFVVPRQFRLAQIFIGVPKSTNQTEEVKAQARLDALLKKVRRPEADFSAIAKTDSEEPESAAKGGEIGWLPENRIQPEIRLRILGQARNVVSEPIRLDDGWHIVKLLDVKEAYTAPLAEVREQLAATLRTERAKSERQAYLTRLMQKSPISINELAVSSVVEKRGK